MRRVRIVIEDMVGDRVFKSERTISPTLLDMGRDPESILRIEYLMARKKINDEIDEARKAGPKGKLP
jgi:hypothetical protein